ncbi:DUF7507 domain-containing protein [Texcoconibacillus texcoconensis]|uniref:DUF7507 domain-containing protein n=1 Tax=Texcoconibacillus texcoconensis TaxID=1095777 RepID=A0A840QQB8_9BACI|nr:hypothetical protein [Texcoconibacillus texcoconensis]MBB5173626.1 hypothetical protein [Texcoconibacillus texcoconensis]
MVNRPNVNEINDYLVIGMRPSEAGEAVTIGSSQEIGANRQTLSGGNPGDPFVSPITPNINPPYPAPSSPNLRSVFFPDPSDPTNPNVNRWLWDSNEQAHFLPDANLLFRGVDWTGNVAVTSPTGTYSLQDINVFADIGFATTWNQAADDVENSYYFDENSLSGVLMSDASPDPARGWVAPFDHTQLLSDLRDWREFIRNLPRDAFFDSGDPANPRDVINRNSIATVAGGKLIYDVAGMDINNDGFVVIDIQYDGTDFEVNNSDWIITNSDPEEEEKLVIFRIRGEANMNMSNSSIMVGDGLECPDGLSVMFVKAHPEEEFTSLSGSSDQVFDANNLVINGIGFWDLNTIGDAETDEDFGPPTDPDVYINVDFPTTDFVDRNQQDNYTEISISNAQGCGQFISPFVEMQNVRFIRCAPCPEVVEDPAIDLEKFVSPDGGTTFFDADTPPGPNIPEGIDPVFRYVVTNTGNVPLENITLTDDVLGPITIPSTTLDPGESFAVEITGTWAEGQQVNIAIVTGDYEDITVTDEDPAHYVGVVEPAPAIDLEKFVSPDGGTTFFDADTPPGPDIPVGTDPVFRFIVTNTGNVPLENITLTDDVLGPITIPTTTLDPGESFTVDVTGTWAEGQQVNTATVTGEYEDITVTDEDPAHYVGVVEPAPAIDLEKFVSPDGGTTFFDADTPPGPNIPEGTDPVFRFIVTNTGNVPLENTTLTDDVLGPITIPTTTLDPGESFTVDVTGTWAEGQQVNTATVTGEYEDITVSDEDPAHYVGVVPSLEVEKLVSVDGGETFEPAPSSPGPTLPEGVTVQFQFIVTNTGPVPITNITIEDSELGIVGVIPVLQPGESQTFIASP